MSDTYADADAYSVSNSAAPIGEEITPKKVRDKWDAAMRATQNERQQAALNERFCLNKHWVYWNRGSGRLEELPRQPERVRATIARIGPDSNRLIAKMTQNDLVFEVMPDTPDDAAIQASRVSEAAINQIHDEDMWEDYRYDHAMTTWIGGTGGVCTEWDFTIGEPIAVNPETGDLIHAGGPKLTVLSIHEIGLEPGTRNGEKGFYWIRGMAMPPAEVQEYYNLENLPKADARAVDTVWRTTHDDYGTYTPLTMVYVYYERPHGKNPGRVVTVVNDEFVNQGPWPFPFKDKLNLSLAKVQPIHGRWLGHTPVTDAVPVQAAMNASWSSIIEHMKQAGNARLWIPEGSVDNVQDLSDLPGESAEYIPVNGASPHYESPPSMPEWWIRQPAMLGDAMDDILGGNDISRGNAPAGVESGIALSILSENSDTPVGRFAKNVNSMWGRVASQVLEMLEVHVKDKRRSTIQMPDAKIPEIIEWSGNTIAGHTTALVPSDAASMRGRSAQAAWAMQLFDRGIIQTPHELAKLADLPNQSQILNATDPDTARALRENAFLSSGNPRTVDVIDDHANHIFHHRNFARSERYEHLEPDVQELFRMHMMAHEMYAADQMAAQANAASVSPLAASLPTQATSAMDQKALAEAAGMAAFAPSAATGPPGAGMGMSPEAQTQMMQQAGAQSPGVPTPAGGGDEGAVETMEGGQEEAPPQPPMGTTGAP